MDPSLTLRRGTEARVNDTSGWDADRAITVLYSAHYRQLVRIAGLLLRDFSAGGRLTAPSARPSPLRLRVPEPGGDLRGEVGRSAAGPAVCAISGSPCLRGFRPAARPPRPRVAPLR
jgi:hypothetical protein